MTEHHWDPLRTRAIRQLGESPNAPTEQDIIEAFKENPRHVTAVIEAVTAERASGVVLRSAWAVIRYRTKTNPTEDVVATDQSEKTLRVKQAEAFIRNAGVYLERENELLDEFFGDLGSLRDWKDQGLEERMAALWHEQRPRGEQAETDAWKRALERVELRAKLAEARRNAVPHLEPEHESDPNWHTIPEPELTEA